ncbi:MAG: DNA polymerase/3'-5' exonuclease PolX [Anaerolineae bacterium]|nr:MAG: DNA polymerase/3'-5' exonuclease PolX [Anaerolineae bacterium]
MSVRPTNQAIADALRLIADLLEIKGEVIYKILAYRKAADALTALGRDVRQVWQQGELTAIPGVGKAIAEKIDELLRTGELDFLNRLAEEVPLTLAEMLKIPGLGPKKVGLFWRELGITTIDELRAAAEAGRLRALPGMGAKSEARILRGIEALARRSGRIPLGVAWPFAQDLLIFLRALPGVQAAEAAGSLRRMRATVGDLDLLAAAADSAAVIRAFTSRPDVVEILGQGTTKASVEFANGLRAQLWVHPPERFGTALQYATGSKDHNVRLRELALRQGYSLSEQALKRLEDDTEILCSREEEVYRILGMSWIPPEMREDRGEIQAAREGKLPALIEVRHLRAELHCHSTWSDGRASIRQMAQAAIERGLQVLAITDHSQSLGIANGLTPERLRAQRAEIQSVQAELGDAILLLQGAEVEIKADGSLDYSEEVLAGLDVVVASLHTSLSQPREKITRRLLNAIRNPHVDIIGHPSGRLLPDREGADLDMEAVLQAAAESGVALEINAHPSRLDLEDIYARRAAEMGILLSINTDAHAPQDFDLAHFGVAVARRAWLEPSHVLNAWTPARIRAWLEKRARP